MNHLVTGHGLATPASQLSSPSRIKEKMTLHALTEEYLACKHQDMVEVAAPTVTYTEYCNSVAVVPGKVVETEEREETLKLVADVAARAPPSTDTVSWFHMEGVNSQLLRDMMKLLKLRGADPFEAVVGINHGKSRTAKRDTVRMIQMRHSEPALRWFGTHLYFSMQMLDRENIEDDIPLVADQQVSFIYVPNRRLIISVAEELGSDFELLRETLVNGASTCNDSSTDPTMLLAVIADKILDDAFPMAEEMGDYLELVAHSMLHKPGTEWNTPADKVRMQLWRMRRFSFRLRRLTETFLEDSLQLFQNVRFQHYIREVDKQAKSLEELCGMYIDRCRFILQRIEAVQNKKTNDTLMVLTILTALVIPAQFLTGVWGMNFSVMPELGLKYGYVMFWTLVPVLTGLSFWLLRRNKMVTTDLDHTVNELLPRKMVKNIMKKFKKMPNDIRAGDFAGMRNMMKAPATMIKKLPSVALPQVKIGGSSPGVPSTPKSTTAVNQQ